MEEYEKLALKFFDIPKLYPLQEKVLQELDKETVQNVLAIMPTGSGKTLLYALTALKKNRLVIVISPLIALIRNQVQRMLKAHIEIAFFSHDQTQEEKLENYQSFHQKKARLLFLSPERLGSFPIPFAPYMVVVDEAHCLLSWGSQFRPEYLKLSKTIELLKPEKILGLTATASSKGQKILENLLFPASYGKVSRITSSPLGTHIHVQSQRCATEQEKWLMLTLLLKKNRLHSIIYFPRRTQCDEAAQKLNKLDIKAISYHAGIPSHIRIEKLDYLTKHLASSDKPLVICATSAFGMGIDLKNISLVLCYGFPGNIEEFFQMIGRGGRQGEPSQGVLLWTGADPKKRWFQFNATYPSLSLLKKEIAHFKEYPEPSHLSNPDLWEPIMSALRLCGNLEETNHYQVSWKEKLEDLKKALPSSPTQRGQFLESLIDKKKSSFRSYIESPTDNDLRILRYYESQNKCTLEPQIRYIPQSQNFSLYEKFQSQAKESLMQLEMLAKATQCRLKQASLFFGQTPFHHCNQCDLCLEKNNYAQTSP